MERDLRPTALYQAIATHFQRALAPGFGRISGAADPAPSSDGERIAFTGSRWERLEGLPQTRICLLTRQTGAWEEITAGPHNDLMPRWSPDGMRLAFLSDRTRPGQHQVYLLEADRLGEARAVPPVEGTVESIAWAPDGRALLLVVAGPGADIADAQGAGTTPHLSDDLPAWMPAVDNGITAQQWRRLWRYDLASGTMRLLTRSGLNVWEAAWVGPDRIAAIVSTAPREGAWYTAQLALIDGTSGVEEILYASPRQLGVPAGTPAGERLAVIQALCSDRGLVAGDLLLFDGQTTTPRAVETGGVDVTHLAWRDDQRLVFAGLRGLSTVVGEVDLAAGQTRELWTARESCGLFVPAAVPLGADAVTLVLEGYTRPPELVVVRAGEVTPLARFGHDGSAYQCAVGGTLEEVQWTAPDGLVVEGLLAWPEGPGPHALILNVHGGPVWAYRNCWWLYQDLTRVLVSRGYAVLHPNPRGSMGRGQAFAEQVYGDMGGADTDDLLAGVDALVARGLVDPTRVGVMGVSYGGFMTSWLITQTDRFAAAVAMSPSTDWVSFHYTTYFPDFDRLFLQDVPSNVTGPYFSRSPIMFAGRVRTPTLHTTGGLDEATPAGQAIEFHHALLEQGVPSSLAIYPQEGHDVHRFPAVIDRSTRVVGWFERFMPATPRGADMPGG